MSTKQQQIEFIKLFTEDKTPGTQAVKKAHDQLLPPTGPFNIIEAIEFIRKSQQEGFLDSKGIVYREGSSNQYGKTV